MLFRITRRAATKLKISDGDLNAAPRVASATEWYCNLTTVRRRQIFLFTQAATLFSFWMPAAGVNRQNFGCAFRREATDVIKSYGFSESQVAKVLDDGPDAFGKSLDRGVIGSMVDFVKMLSYVSDDDALFMSKTARELNDIANRCPMSKLGMDYPIERLTVLLSSVGAA